MFLTLQQLKDRCTFEPTKMSVPKRNRSHNYSVEETLSLLDIVIKYKHIVEKKKTDSVTLRNKVKAWQAITKIHNARNKTPRSSEQLKLKYDSLKKDARRHVRHKQQNSLQIGEGPVLNNEVHDKVIEFLKLSSEGNDSMLNLDASILIDEVSCVETPEVDVQVSMVHVESEASTEQWSKCVPQMLQDPIILALQVNENGGPVLEEESPASSESSTYLSRLSPLEMEGSIEEEESIKNPETNIEIPRLKGRVPSDVPDKRSKLSLTMRNHEPWMMAKTELVRQSVKGLKRKQENEEKYEKELHELHKKKLELEIECLRREHEERQLHEKQLYNLKMKELELNIKIKEANLRNMDT